MASKAALNTWTRCASSEFADQGIGFTTINMPLVRTPIIAQACIFTPGEKPAKQSLSAEAVALQMMMRGYIFERVIPFVQPMNT